MQYPQRNIDRYPFVSTKWRGERKVAKGNKIKGSAQERREGQIERKMFSSFRQTEPLQPMETSGLTGLASVQVRERKRQAEWGISSMSRGTASTTTSEQLTAADEPRDTEEICQAIN